MFNVDTLRGVANGRRAERLRSTNATALFVSIDDPVRCRSLFSMKVLFVDDERRVLEALERSLRMGKVAWQTCFVDSGEAALAVLASEQYDVIVSDMRMPRMDGATLLAAVCERNPAMVRIVLSGQADEASALRAVRVAHQFLSKPCDSTLLRQVVERTGALHRTLTDLDLRAIVGGVVRLPSALHVFQELNDLLARDEASTDSVSAVVCQDPAMASKLLQFANSAFFASSRHIPDIRTAVIRLGMKTIKNLVLGVGVFDAVDSAALPAGCSIDELQRRAFTTARIASGIVANPEHADAAFMAGLVCDLGELVLASQATTRLVDAWTAAKERGVPRSLAEREVFGVSHAEVGACLLGLWGLPFQVVEAVAHHHAPERGAHPGLGLPQVVWIAACVAAAEDPSPDLIRDFDASELLERAQALARAT
jgi:HD-like signal output (HDOD) protein/CheY-like chemotaxis protein